MNEFIWTFFDIFRPETSHAAHITHIMFNHDEPIGQYTVVWIFDRTKKLIYLSRGYFGILCYATCRIPKHFLISFFKIKLNSSVNLTILSDVPIVMNSRCTEFTSKKTSQQLQSSFGSLTAAYFRPHSSQLRYSAQQLTKRETATGSKWIHTEPAGSQKTHHNPKHTILIILGKIQIDMHTCSIEHFHTGDISQVQQWISIMWLQWLNAK